MWILLTAKLPTKPSPPKLSIFWSLPWPENKYVEKLRGKKRFTKTFFGGDIPDWIERQNYEDARDANEWEGARKIRYKDENIRIFPHEFNPVETKFIEDMLNGGAHTLIPESPAEEAVIQRTLRKGEREIYEAAIVDGATEAQAMATALRQDVTLPDWKFPPVGWYKPNPEYAIYYCEPWEMK